MTSARTYPSRPFLGVSAVLHHGDECVLIERGRPPATGMWSIPGGTVETGETLEAAIRREIREEIGIDFTPDHMGDLVEILRFDEDAQCQRHYVIAVFYAAIPRHSLVAGDDASQAHWVNLSELANYPLTDGTQSVIEKIIAGAQLRLHQP